jgi:hypothetical protein
MRLLGDWNWYLPGFLGWLPHVTIEVEPEADRNDGAPVEHHLGSGLRLGGVAPEGVRAQP